MAFCLRLFLIEQILKTRRRKQAAAYHGLGGDLPNSMEKSDDIMYRYAKQALCVLIIGILLAALIFVLLFAGVLTLELAEGVQTASLVLAALSLLLLLPLALIFRRDRCMALARRYFGTMILVGAVGMLVTSFLMFLVIALPITLMVAVAVNFFFLTLLLGGNLLLILAHLDANAEGAA